MHYFYIEREEGVYNLGLWSLAASKNSVIYF